jgi:hypothetical protein
MIRRDFLRRIVYGGTALAATGTTGKLMEQRLEAASAHIARETQEKRALPILTATPFALEDVRILDADFGRKRSFPMNMPCGSICSSHRKCTGRKRASFFGRKRSFPMNKGLV